MADISLLPVVGKLDGLTTVQKINEGLTSLNEANRLGIPAWSSTTSYGAGALAWDAGQTYKSTVANSGQRPSTTPASWVSWGLTLSDLQNGYETMAVATGTAGVYAATYWPAITGLSDGQRLRFKVPVVNPGACTLAVNAIPAAPIVGQAGFALQGGELTAAGVATVTWSATHNAFVLVTCEGGSLQVTDGSKSHHAVSVGQFGALTSANGYQKMPSGLIVQWGFANNSASADVAVTFPIAFPNSVCSVVITADATGAGIFDAINSRTLTGFKFSSWIATGSRAGITGNYWIATGY